MIMSLKSNTDKSNKSHMIKYYKDIKLHLMIYKILSKMKINKKSLIRLKFLKTRKSFILKESEITELQSQ